jgi:hypothetical protein
MEIDFVPRFNPDSQPVLDLRTRDSGGEPTMAFVTFAQPGTVPASVGVVIDNWMAGDLKFDRDVQRLAGILRGAAHGIFGSFLEPATDGEIWGYRAGLITAGEHRIPV